MTLGRSAHRWLALLALVAGCTGEPDVGPELPCGELAVTPGRQPRNLVLVINDAMRRDRVGVYGGSARTPSFDRFAEAHLIFDRAFTQAPWTKPSMASLFTGYYPSQHGVVTHPGRQAVAHARLTREIGSLDVLSPEYETLAETLQAAGWQTAAIVSNPWLDSRFGFDQGFAHYDDSFARWSAAGADVTAAALDRLDAVDPDRPFFLYVHYVDSHRPHPSLAWDEVQKRDQPAQAGSGLSRLARLEIRALITFDGHPAGVWPPGLEPSADLVAQAYDLGLAAFDRGLEPLLAALAERADWDRTAVIVTSDHGEALFERGYGNHGTGLYDDELRIPMAARLPGVVPDRGQVDCAVGLVDLLPSLCTYLGVTCPPSSGLSFLRGEQSPATEPRYLVSEGVMSKPRNRAIRNGHYKLLWQPDGASGGEPGPNPRPLRLYAWADDPDEEHDLLDPEIVSEETQQIARTLREALVTAVPHFEPPETETAPLDPELERRLRELGYLEDNGDANLDLEHSH